MSNSRLVLPTPPDQLSLHHQQDDRSRKSGRLPYVPVVRLFPSLAHPLRFVYALRLATSSFLLCMRTLLSTKHWSVDLGPAFESLPSGCLILNGRTDARSDGIRELKSRYPGANTLLLEVFLEGFDTGEQYALHKQGKPEKVICYSSVASHFQSCQNNPKKQIDLDMLKRHWYKSQYESLGLRNPSQSG